MEKLKLNCVLCDGKTREWRFPDNETLFNKINEIITYLNEREEKPNTYALKCERCDNPFHSITTDEKYCYHCKENKGFNECIGDEIESESFKGKYEGNLIEDMNKLNEKIKSEAKKEVIEEIIKYLEELVDNNPHCSIGCAFHEIKTYLTNLK